MNNYPPVSIFTQTFQVICIFSNTYLHTHTSTHTHSFTDKLIHTNILTHTQEIKYIFVCTYVCMCIYMNIYIHAQTHAYVNLVMWYTNKIRNLLIYYGKIEKNIVRFYRQGNLRVKKNQLLMVTKMLKFTMKSGSCVSDTSWLPTSLIR